jgi:hypothetical protein
VDTLLIAEDTDCQIEILASLAGIALPVSQE